ncbi:MAG: putative DNA binding domain-containing protein [Firmicutes bacterium]|nr:putative DNA binding domain-containing protein [Bacillota bacterium]
MRETKDLEYKESITSAFLKTVSAFANYGTGVILFGVADDGSIKGIDEPEKACLDIENRINDSIDPVPEYLLSINRKTSVITLRVQEGLHKPYLYKSKAYRRNDSATVMADRLELSRLILEGQNLSFEELPASNQQLSFEILEDRLTTTLHIENFSMDTLKTLELYNDETGYNKAGELLADTNDLCGTDIVRFGDSINIILDRAAFERQSILKQYDLSLEMYHKYYQYEQIKGAFRETVSLIPEEAFREAIANALVHRTWDVNANINVAMFTDRIDITSPGGLPRGISEEEYLRGGISILRNRIIGSVFLRLQMIEKFGTGIRRILEAYKNSNVKPRFEVTENTIKISLPVIQINSELTVDENKVFSLLKGKLLSSSMVAEATGFGKSKTVIILNGLVKAGYIRVLGNGRGTKYTAD